MEVDQVGWGERNSGEQYDDEENPEEDDNSINYVGGKSGGKHGKGANGSVKARARASRGAANSAYRARVPQGKREVIGTKAATGKAMAREQARGRGLAFSAPHNHIMKDCST